MESNKDENIYKKKQLINNLDKILAQVTFFFKNCEKHNLDENELNNLIYTHSIYKNRKRISEFLDKINNSEGKIRDKVIELQEESEMRQKKKNEIEDLKNILNVNVNNNLLTQESQDKSIVLITEGLTENKTENDILIEDSKDVENKNLLKKKRGKDKDKDKEDETKEKYIYKSCYICKQRLGLDNISKFYGSL